MSRAVPEWIATHDDQAIPRLVKARIWARCEGKCALTGKKLTPADKPEFDHIVPLADGGEHRETNLQLVSGEAHKAKTKAEAPQRAKERRIHAKFHGYWPASKTPLKGRGFEAGRNRNFAPKD
jgi:5-methylcytosine-specific restriction endonuclease McrA